MSYKKSIERITIVGTGVIGGQLGGSISGARVRRGRDRSRAKRGGQLTQVCGRSVARANQYWSLQRRVS